MELDELQKLDGKLRRVVWSTVKMHLLENTTLLDKKQAQQLAERLYQSIMEANESALEYFEMYEILKPVRAKKKKRGK